MEKFLVNSARFAIGFLIAFVIQYLNTIIPPDYVPLYYSAVTGLAFVCLATVVEG